MSDLMNRELIVYKSPSIFTAVENATLNHGTNAEMQRTIVDAMIRSFGIPRNLVVGDSNYSSAKLDALALDKRNVL